VEFGVRKLNAGRTENDFIPHVLWIGPPLRDENERPVGPKKTYSNVVVGRQGAPEQVTLSRIGCDLI
jgi:hypothetical protein